MHFDANSNYMMNLILKLKLLDIFFVHLHQRQFFHKNSRVVKDLQNTYLLKSLIFSSLILLKFQMLEVIQIDFYSSCNAGQCFWADIWCSIYSFLKLLKFNYILENNHKCSKLLSL